MVSKTPVATWAIDIIKDLSFSLTMKSDKLLSGLTTANVCIDVHVHGDTKGHMCARDLCQTMLVSENCDTMWQCRPGLPTLSHWAMVLSRPVLLPRAVSGFLFQQPPGSGLMDVAPIVVEGFIDAQSLSGPETSHLRPCWCLRAWLLLEP